MKLFIFFNIIFLLSIKSFVFYMLKMNFLITSRKQFLYLYSKQNSYKRLIVLNGRIKGLMPFMGLISFYVLFCSSPVPI